MPELPPWIPDRRREIGDRIRDHRLWANRTQDDIALRTGLDRRTVQRIERAETDVRLTWLLLVADALDLTLEQLLGEDPPRPAR